MRGQIMSKGKVSNKDLTAIGLSLVAVVLIAQNITASTSLSLVMDSFNGHSLVKRVHAEGEAATFSVKGQQDSTYSTLQEAVTAAANTDSKTVNITEGTLTLSSMVTVPAGVSVIGAGNEQTFVVAAENFTSSSLNSYGYLFALNGGSTLSNMTLTGTQKGDDNDGSVQGVHIASASGSEITLSSLKIQDSGKHGINVYQTTAKVKISDVKITNSAGFGVNVNGSSEVVAENLEISGSGWDQNVGVDNGGFGAANFVWKSGSVTLNESVENQVAVGIDGRANTYQTKFTIGDTAGNFITREVTNASANDRFSHADYFLGTSTPTVKDIYDLAVESAATDINYQFSDGVAVSKTSGGEVLVSANTSQKTVSDMSALTAQLNYPVTAVHMDNETKVQDYTVAVVENVTQVTILNESLGIADVVKNIGTTLTSLTVKKGEQTVTVSTDQTDQVAAVKIGDVTTYYGSFGEALTVAAGQTATITLLGDTTDDYTVNDHKYEMPTGSDLTIDLAGHTLDTNRIYRIKESQVTVTGGTMRTAGSYIFQVRGSSSAADAAARPTKLTINNDAVLESTSTSTFYLITNPNYGGTAGEKYGVNIKIAGTLKGTNSTDGYGIFVGGNYMDESADINYEITDTAFFETPYGMAINGYAKVKFAGTIDAAITGIEVRSGSLEATSGAIIAHAKPTSATSNWNGTTTTGAAIGISSYGYGKINVRISGGTYSGYTPVYESNPNNISDVSSKETINISGGFFDVIEDGTEAVHSQNLTKFLTGGTYSVAPDATYLADGYINHDNGDGTYTVMRAYDSVSAAITALAGDSSEDLPAVKVVTSDTDSAENNALVAKDSGYYRVEAAEAEGEISN